MKNLHFFLHINAAREAVWRVLWEDATYRQWTEPFMKGSYAVSYWNEGDEVRFLGPDGSGMVSRIDRKVEGERMAFTHVGVLKNGEKRTDDAESRAWAGAQEIYTLQERNGGTDLVVTVDVTAPLEAVFQEAFPQGLAIVRSLAEKAP